MTRPLLQGDFQRSVLSIAAWLGWLGVGSPLGFALPYP